jgi:uncharacterized protein (DUF302 family)
LITRRSLYGCAVMAALMWPLTTTAEPADKAPLKPLVTATSWVYSVEGEFAEVKQDLLRAIETQGAVVSYVGHVDAMLNRTAEDLKVNHQVYGHAEVVLFCKAEVTHKLLQSDPHALVLCPYTIAVYTLAANPQIVYLAINKPPQNVVIYAQIHALLQLIITDTITF